MGNNERKLDIIMRFFIFVFFLKSWEFAGAQNFFDKSQIVCPGKISELPQSTLCGSKTPILKNVYNKTDMRHNERDLDIIVRFFGF